MNGDVTGKDFNDLQESLKNGDDVQVNLDDAVINPEHYKHGKFETIHEMMIVFGPEATVLYCRMCAWKYRARAPYKGEFFEDQAKANWYLAKADEIMLSYAQAPQQQMM